MNNKYAHEMEIEKNRQEILAISRKIGDKKNLKSSNQSINQLGKKEQMNRYAWEYELKEYRRRKKWEKFYFLGALCGILSLALTLWLHGEQLIGLVK